MAIEPAQDGGYFVEIKIYKELEDLPRPVRATAGAASFRSDNTVDRTYEVVDPAYFESNWIPLGRDCEFMFAGRHVRECVAAVDAADGQVPAECDCDPRYRRAAVVAHDTGHVASGGGRSDVPGAPHHHQEPGRLRLQ